MKLICEAAEDVKYQITEAKETGKKNFYITGVFAEANSLNKNKRVYPKHIMEKAVNTYIQEKVNTHRAFGELDHPCFGPTAQALTSTGWKYIKDISVGEQVYTFNMETQKMELQPVLEIHINDYQGDMIRIHNRTFDTVVTPYHHFVIIERNGEAKFISAKDIEWGIENRVNKLAHAAIPKNGQFDGIGLDTITVGHRNIPADLFLDFLGIWLAEGYVRFRRYSYQTTLYQNAGPKADKIQKLLDQFTETTGIKWNRKEKQSVNTQISWTTYSKSLGQYLIDLGKHDKKYIPQDILDGVSSKQADSMINWFILGDGRGIPDTKYSKSDMFSTSAKLIDDMSILATKAGHSYHTYTVSEFEDYDFAGRKIRAVNKKPLHFLQLSTRSNVYLDGRFMSTERVPWNDKIYCLTTPNDTFLAKDNGYCFWTGNSGPKINPDRISHLIEELEWNGNQLYGKAKILDTPMGNIARGIMEGGGSLGVSTRGMGEVKKNPNGIMEVQEGLRYSTIADIVTDPSAHNAWVNSIMENTEFYYDNFSGEWQQKVIEETVKEIKTMSKKQLEEQSYISYHNFIKSLLR